MNTLNALTGIRAVIIDLDGTMLHTAPDFQIAINNMRDELDLTPLPIEQITQFVGKGTEHLVRNALATSLKQEQVEQLFEQALESYQRHYLSINGDHAKIYPGVHEGLKAMQSQGLRLACVTNKPIEFAVPLMKKKELHHYFEIIYGGNSLPKKKPDPYPLLQVFADFDLQPRQVVAIGDSSNDSQAARAAGCWVLNVPYGYNHGVSIQQTDSDGIVPTLLDAARLISA
jgi:phosphoglycolate phosphatase